MKTKFNSRWITAVCLLLVLIAIPGYAQIVSKPGQYSGYSTPICEGSACGWVRSSQYVTVRDGTKLAIDIFRPAVNGVIVNTPYPVVFQQTQYRRAYYSKDKDGNTVLNLTGKSMADSLTKYGYVVAVGDPRGVGASYGTRGVSWDTQEAEDTHDLIEWLGVQPWSNGNVGMWGGSYMGGIQVLTAATRPRHLKAIFPAQTPFDQYDELYTIPEFRGPMGELSSMANDANSVPVDGDVGGVLLNEAVQQHKPHYDAIKAYAESLGQVGGAYSQVGIAPYRDSVGPVSGTQYYYEASPSSYIHEIHWSGVGIYNMGYWNNWLRRGSISAFSNFRNPSKLLMTASSMMPTFNFNMEHLRYFDYWLKGVNNGIMDEPPIYYNVLSAPAGDDWRYSWRWPLPNQKNMSFYLAEGSSDSMNQGLNKGILTQTGPSAKSGEDVYTVSYGISSANQDSKGLTYTTQPLTTDMEVTGHPVVELWVSSDHDDGDFVVNLEEVDTLGKSTTISTGKLRASLRKIADPPFDYMGLPWRRALQRDERKLVSGKPVKLVFDLLPVSKVFKTGNRIRVNIVCDSAPNTPVLSPVPVVNIYRNVLMKSYVSLPVIAEPIQISVETKPEMLNLKSKGEVTVFITPSHCLGKGYGERDIDVSTLTCNGVSPIGTYVAHDTLVAKFKRQDVVDTSTGRYVKLNVTGKFYYDIPFAGSDTMRLMK
jgi:putative CocE/NonD family hydrolase